MAILTSSMITLGSAFVMALLIISSIPIALNPSSVFDMAINLTVRIGVVISEGISVAAKDLQLIAMASHISLDSVIQEWNERTFLYVEHPIVKFLLIPASPSVFLALLLRVHGRTL